MKPLLLFAAAIVAALSAFSSTSASARVDCFRGGRYVECQRPRAACERPVYQEELYQQPVRRARVCPRPEPIVREERYYAPPRYDEPQSPPRFSEGTGRVNGNVRFANTPPPSIEGGNCAVGQSFLAIKLTDNNWRTLQAQEGPSAWWRAGVEGQRGQTARFRDPQGWICGVSGQQWSYYGRAERQYWVLP